jgi:hypothetical protein
MIHDEAQYLGKLYSFSRSFRHVQDQPCIPLVASELHNIAQGLPVLFRKSALGWQVVGLAADPALRRPKLDQAGHWREGYAPFCLRIHPFRLRANGDGWEVAPEKVVAAPGRGRPFFQPDGSRAAEYAKVLGMLADADGGRAALAVAAAALETFGLLGPVPLLFEVESLSPVLSGLFCVDAVRFASLSPGDLATLAGGAPSALDLGLASIFSLRLLRGHYGGRGAAAFEDRIEALIAGARQARGSEAYQADLPQPLPDMPVAAVTLKGFSLDQSASLDFAGLA